METYSRLLLVEDLQACSSAPTITFLDATAIRQLVQCQELDSILSGRSSTPLDWGLEVPRSAVQLLVPHSEILTQITCACHVMTTWTQDLVLEGMEAVAAVAVEETHSPVRLVPTTCFSRPLPT